jgi:RsiW-degrading membrane proteinase PrsW (M82 family)
VDAPHAATPGPPTAQFCPRCGRARALDGRFCRQCGWDYGSAAQPVAAAVARPSSNRKILLGLGGCAGLGCFSVLALCTVLLLVASIPDPVGLGLSTIAAFVPAVLYSFIVLYIDRYEAEPWYTLVGAFLWGAVVAVVFSVIFELIAGGIVFAAYGPEAGEFIGLAVIAPIVEEVTKGAALVVLLIAFRNEFDDVLDGIVYGALVGLGFAMTENILYFGAIYLEEGVVGLGVLFVLRVVLGGFAHALYTGTTGAGLGWARSRYGRGVLRVLVPLGALLLAILQHALWNGTAYVLAENVSDEPTVGEILLLFLFEPAVFLLPPLIIAAVVAVVVNGRQLRIIRDQLSDEVARGTLSDEQLAMLSNGRLRRRATRRAILSGNGRYWWTQRRFMQVASDLAYQKYHESRGETHRRGLRRRTDDQLRRELRKLRVQLTSA